MVRVAMKPTKMKVDNKMSEQPQANTEASTLKGFKELSDIPARQVFKAAPDAPKSAVEALKRILATPGADALPVVVYGAKEDGSVDWSGYNGQDIYLIGLRNKGAGIRAVVLQPAPTINSFLTAPEAGEWIADLLETQIAHKMVRSLRAPKGDTAVAITPSDIDAIPHSIADYVASARLGGAVALWNKYAKKIIDAMGSKVAAFRNARVTKELLRKAIESKQFAEAVYPSFEAADLFSKAANGLISLGMREGSDVSLIQSWLENRANVKADEAGLDDDIADLDADELFGDLGDDAVTA